MGSASACRGCDPCWLLRPNCSPASLMSATGDHGANAVGGYLGCADVTSANDTASASSMRSACPTGCLRLCDCWMPVEEDLDREGFHVPEQLSTLHLADAVGIEPAEARVRNPPEVASRFPCKCGPLPWGVRTSSPRCTLCLTCIAMCGSGQDKPEQLSILRLAKRWMEPAEANFFLADGKVYTFLYDGCIRPGVRCGWLPSLPSARGLKRIGWSGPAAACVAPCGPQRCCTVPSASQLDRGNVEVFSNFTPAYEMDITDLNEIGIAFLQKGLRLERLPLR